MNVASMVLFGPEMLADPYPTFRYLRETDPVHWHVPFGAWMLSAYGDVVAAFHDPRLSSERAEPLRALAASSELDPFFDYLACRMDFRDPPAHARLRGLVSQVFTPHAVAALRPRIEELVEQFLDRVAGQSRMDVIADLAFPLPGTVIAELLGVPAEDRQRLKDWSDAFVGFFKTVPSETTAAEYRRSHRQPRSWGPITVPCCSGTRAATVPACSGRWRGPSWLATASVGPNYRPTPPCSCTPGTRRPPT